MMHDDWMSWSSSGMWIVDLLLITFIGGLVGFWFPRLRQSKPPAPPQRTPLAILDERFAKGEIDQSEYDARRKVLSH